MKDFMRGPLGHSELGCFLPELSLPKLGNTIGALNVISSLGNNGMSARKQLQKHLDAPM